MSQIIATAAFAGAALPSGVTVASVAIVVTDASGAPQTANVNGSESPPWSAPFTVAAGAGSVTFTRTDSTGAVGAPIPVSYDTGTVTPGAADLSGGTVQIVTP